MRINLKAIAERNPDVRIFVRGDKSVDYGRVMAVVSAINQAGLSKVALLTEAPKPTLPGKRAEQADQRLAVSSR